MDLRVIKIIVLDWLLFLLSPILIILLNSMTLFKVVKIGSDVSGTYQPFGGMIVILLDSAVGLGVIFYFGVWRFTKLTREQFDRKSFYTKVTVIYCLLVLFSLGFVDLSRFSNASVVFLDLTGVLGFSWLLFLTFETLLTANKTVMGFLIISQVLSVLLGLNSFYIWNI